MEIKVYLVEMFKGPRKKFEIEECSRERVVEIERVHCKYVMLSAS